MKKVVLYISYDGMTDPLGQSQVIPYLSQLSRLNYEIHLLSAEKSDNFSKNELVIKNLLEENSIIWHPIAYTKYPPIISTLKDVMALNKKALVLNGIYKFDFTHCRSYIAALVGLNLKKRKNIPFIFDMRGFWADERVDGKIWNINKFPFNKVYNFFKKKETEFLTQADAVISLTYNAEKIIGSWNDSFKNKITVIPCCADLDYFDYHKIIPSNTENWKTKLGIKPSEFVLTYLGSIGTWYLLDEMLDFFKVLQKKKSAKFLFITKDNPEEIYNTAKNKNISKESIIIQPAERQELAELLSVSDASIFFIMPTFSKKASSPTKQAELLGMGIPLICNADVGDTNEIIEKEKVGVVLKELNEQTYLNVCEDIQEITEIDKKHLRSIAQQYFSLSSGVDRYNKVYSEIK